MAGWPARPNRSAENRAQYITHLATPCYWLVENPFSYMTTIRLDPGAICAIRQVKLNVGEQQENHIRFLYYFIHLTDVSFNFQIRLFDFFIGRTRERKSLYLDQSLSDRVGNTTIYRSWWVKEARFQVGYITEEPLKSNDCLIFFGRPAAAVAAGY